MSDDVFKNVPCDECHTEDGLFRWAGKDGITLCSVCGDRFSESLETISTAEATEHE